MKIMTDLTTTLRERLGLADPVPVGFPRGDVQEGDGFDRERIEYRGLEGDLIPAFLFAPRARDTLGTPADANPCSSAPDAVRAEAVLSDVALGTVRALPKTPERTRRG